MNVRRIASSAALALALVATTSPAWSADGTRTGGGTAWAGGNSGIASYLAREFARNPAPVTRALGAPRVAYSWSHDSRIPTRVTPSAGTSWSHDSRIPAPVTRRAAPRGTRVPGLPPTSPKWSYIIEGPA